MMAEQLNATTEARERPSDIVDQLRAAGVDYALTMKVLECVKAERAEAIAKTARLFYCRTGEHRPMTLSEFSDELNNTSRRLWGSPRRSATSCARATTLSWNVSPRHLMPSARSHASRRRDHEHGQRQRRRVAALRRTAPGVSKRIVAAEARLSRCSIRSTAWPILRKTIRRKRTRRPRTWATTSRA